VPEPIKFLDILEVLCREEVDFILVGGVAAVLAGAPVSTFDLDIVFLNESANRKRLLIALEAIDAKYLDPAGRTITPDLNKLETMQLHRLKTTHGVLDVMTQIGRARTYSSLVGQTRLLQVAEFSVRVLSLSAVVDSKIEAGRDKDLAVLPILRRTLELEEE